MCACSNKENRQFDMISNKKQGGIEKGGEDEEENHKFQRKRPQAICYFHNCQQYKSKSDHTITRGDFIYNTHP